MNQKVPFNDLWRQHQLISNELQAAYERVLRESSFIQGEEVKLFEENWSKFLGVKHAIGCANGTDALVLALLALGIGRGDEVVTSSNTFFATVEAIVAVGATPVLADVERDSGLIDAQQVAKLVNKKTKAIIPVHLYGATADMSAINNLAKQHGLAVIEDSAQAHGARYNDKPAGTLGQMGTFSFFPGKNLGALGDAGALVTNDDKLAETLRSLRDHGRSLGAKYEHHNFGWNMRMDGLQAAFLSVKLKHLPAWTENRRAIAQFYENEIRQFADLTPLSFSSECYHCYHLFVVLSNKRDQIIEKLRQKGIGVGIHYPKGCHQQPAWIERFGNLQLPNTEYLARSCFSLPIFGDMTLAEAKIVTTALRESLH